MAEIQIQADGDSEFCKKDFWHWQLIVAAKWIQPAKAYEDAACPDTLGGETPSRFLLFFFAADFKQILPISLQFPFRMKRALIKMIPLLYRRRLERCGG